MARRVYGRANQDRHRLKRREPLFPPCAFVPASTCPHGVEIRAGWLCMICHGGAPGDELEIARSRPPRPVEPERRIMSEMAALRELLARQGKTMPGDLKRTTERRLDELDLELRKWVATLYKPNPARKGGR